MTFMRKILDALNMDNWKKNEHPLNFSVEKCEDLEEDVNDEDICQLDASNMENLGKAELLCKQVEIDAKDRKEITGNTIGKSIEISRQFSNDMEQNYRDYAKALIMYCYGDGKRVPGSDGYPAYFGSECNLTNPRKLHIELINNGYFREPTTYEILSSYKVDELKIIADSIGCKKSGKKAELINMIIQSPFFSEGSVEHSSDVFFLSEKGENFLNDNKDLVEFHKRRIRFISLEEYFANRIRGNKVRPFDDIIWEIGCEKVRQNLIRKNYGSVRPIYFCLYEIAMNSRKYDIALKYIISILYIDANCLIWDHLFYGFEAGYYDKESVYEKAENINGFYDNVIKKILPLEDIYSNNFVYEIYALTPISLTLLTSGEMCSAIREMFESSFFNAEKYNKKIRERYIEYIMTL